MTAKTGGMGSAWIVLESPKPPPVSDLYQYWSDRPPCLSPRCRYWLRQVERGWRPNRRIRVQGYDGSAAWYGVYIWEYINVICPMINDLAR